MRKLYSILGTLVLLSSVIAPINLFAQSNDDMITSLLNTEENVGWGYTAADKALIKVVSKTANTATIQMPLALKAGNEIQSYWIVWSPLSYNDVKAGNMDDIDALKDSDTWSKENSGQKMYTVEGGKLLFVIDIDNPSKDIYVTIVPEDNLEQMGDAIYDYNFILDTVNVETTTSLGETSGTDIYNISDEKAIVNVSCYWDNTANRTTLTWDINTAHNASQVQISYRPTDSQGNMTVKNTVNIEDRKYAVATEHRDVQIFNLMPQDAAGNKVGIEIQYICKPDPTVQPETPITPSNPDKPIPVTPQTGPGETTAIVVIVALLAYGIYRGVKKAH